MESTRKPPEPERAEPEATKEDPPSKPSLEKSQAGDVDSVIRRVTEGGPIAYVFTGMRAPKKPDPTEKPKKSS